MRIAVLDICKIRKNKINEAFAQMMEMEMDPSSSEEVAKLKLQYEALKHKQRIGSVSYQKAFLEGGEIAAAMIEIASKEKN